MSTPVAEYFARFGVRVDTAQFDVIDKKIAQIRQRLQSLNMVNSNKRLMLKAELDKTSLATMRQQVLSAIGRITIQADLSRTSLQNSNQASQMRIRELQQRERLNRSDMALLASQSRANRAVTSTSRLGNRATRDPYIAQSVAMGSGFASAGAKALPFIGGAMGLGSIYKQMNNLAGAKMTAEAIFMQYGEPAQRGLDEINWLRNKSLDLGVNYGDQVEEYTGILANGMAVGMSNDSIRDLFTGIAQYSVATHSTPFQQQRVVKAITDMLGKGQVQSQELKIQLGQAMKGAEGQFAKAHDLMVYAKANNLDIFKDRDQLKAVMKSGKINADGKALQRLLDAMTKGQVKSGEILPFFSAYLQDFSEPMLEKRKQASSAILGRVQTRQSMLIEAFGGDIEGRQSGGELGFRRILTRVEQLLEKLLPLAKKLGVLFDNVMYHVTPIITAMKNIVDLIDNVTNSTSAWSIALKPSIAVLLFLTSKWARIFVLIEAIALLINDIVEGFKGNDSITKDILDWIKGLDDATKSAIKLAGTIAGIAITTRMIAGFAGKLGGLGGTVGNAGKTISNKVPVVPVGVTNGSTSAASTVGKLAQAATKSKAAWGLGTALSLSWFDKVKGSVGAFVNSPVGGLNTPRSVGGWAGGFKNVLSKGVDKWGLLGVGLSGLLNGWDSFGSSKYQAGGTQSKLDNAFNIATTLGNAWTSLISPVSNFAIDKLGTSETGAQTFTGDMIHLGSETLKGMVAGFRGGAFGAGAGASVGQFKGWADLLFKRQEDDIYQSATLAEAEGNYEVIRRRLEAQYKANGNKWDYEINNPTAQTQQQTQPVNITLNMPNGAIQINNAQEAGKEFGDYMNNWLTSALVNYVKVN